MEDPSLCFAHAFCLRCYLDALCAALSSPRAGLVPGRERARERLARSALGEKEQAAHAFDAAACIGCGACVAACKNASAMLFVSAKVSQYAVLPQGHPERNTRVINMVAQMDKEGFGSCTNTSECEAACPAEVSVAHIARLNREYLRAAILSEA